MSNVLMRVLLSSGNYALYDVQPQHVPREEIPQSIDWPVMYGTQVAHESQGQWYYPGGWEEIEDKKLCFMFNKEERGLLRIVREASGDAPQSS